MAAVKIGLIGTGTWAQAHARFYREIKGVQLACCLDVDAARAKAFAKEFKVRRVADDLDQLLDQVDAVSVVTPDRFHAKYSLAVLKARRHLMCEKPLTVSLAEARQVAKAARAAGRDGVVHMTNFTYRRSSALQEAIRLAGSGALGEIRHVYSHYLQSWLSANYWGNWHDDWLLWRLQSRHGSRGVLGDLGPHLVDYTTAVAGRLKAVRCALRTFPKVDAGGEIHDRWRGTPLDANDSAVIDLEFENGAVGVSHTTRWATGFPNTAALTVHGTEGAVSVNFDEGNGTLQECLGKSRHKYRWKKRKLEPTPNNFARFIHAIRTGEPADPDVFRGAEVQACLEACEQSAEKGTREPLPAID